jgi:hypothetical protein
MALAGSCSTRVAETVAMPMSMKDGLSTAFLKAWVEKLVKMAQSTLVPSGLDWSTARENGFLPREMTEENLSLECLKEIEFIFKLEKHKRHSMY